MEDGQAVNFDVGGKTFTWAFNGPLPSFDLNRVANSRGATEGQAVLLAVSVYLDIFNLFLALLRLFGFAGSSNRD